MRMADAAVLPAVTGSRRSKPALVGQVERIGALRLRRRQPGQPVDDAQPLCQRQPLRQRRDVAQVARRQDDPVGRLPAELLHDLDADGLLALDAQRVHRIGQVDRIVPRHFLDDPHAAVEVGVERQHLRTVADRLDELRRRDLARGAGTRSSGCRPPRRRPPGPPRCRRSRRRPRRAPGCSRSAIICLTALTSTVIPRSLNEPVWLMPHCLTHRSSRPRSRARPGIGQQRASSLRRGSRCSAARPAAAPIRACPTRPDAVRLPSNAARQPAPSAALRQPRLVVGHFEQAAAVGTAIDDAEDVVAAGTSAHAAIGGGKGRGVTFEAWQQFSIRRQFGQSVLRVPADASLLVRQPRFGIN